MDIDILDLTSAGQQEFAALTLEHASSAVVVPCMYHFIPEVLYQGSPNIREQAQRWLSENKGEDWQKVDTSRLYLPVTRAIVVGNKAWHLDREVAQEKIDTIVATRTVVKRGEARDLYFARTARALVLKLDATSSTDLEDEDIGSELITRAYESASVFYVERRVFPDASFRDTPAVPALQFTELSLVKKTGSTFERLQATKRGALTDLHRKQLAEISCWARGVQAQRLPRPYMFTAAELDKQLEAPEQSAASQLMAALGGGDSDA